MQMQRIGIMTASFVLAATLAQARPAPAFTLQDTTGKSHSLADYKGKVVVLEWTNPDCPFVKKHYKTGNMPKLQKTYIDKGVVWLSVNSSAAGKQGHYSAEEWTKVQADRGAAPTALLLDGDGTAGHAYGAKTTPHMFVIDAAGDIAYEGAIDDKDSTSEEEVAGAQNYVAAAVDALLEDKPVAVGVTPPYGCGVKY